ncbi:excalibur calcium-binding domain-containing protein [Streptomyces althioticus]|uniref:excalibur calcium-binding domain-containing protein n=1 Tax=Streptomyces althioticus TaxID=83380 RepID=UPI0018744632
MAGGARRGGSVWRVRRRWARTGLFGRIVITVLSLLTALITLGGVLQACGAPQNEPKAPVTTSYKPSSTPPALDPPARPTKDTEATASLTDVTPPDPTVGTSETPTERETVPPSANSVDVYYDNCDEARAAGAAPLYAGDPGYGTHLDRDGDGVACEPYAGP